VFVIANLENDFPHFPHFPYFRWKRK